MTDRTDDDELDKIMDDFVSAISLPGETQKETEPSDNSGELSKEKVADEFDVRFAKSPKGNTQHLVSPEDNTIFCRTPLTDGFTTSEDPGPFDPICAKCRKQLTGETQGSASGNNTIADYRQWLANEIDGVNEKEDMPARFRKPEMAAIIFYIQLIKNNQ